MRPAVFSSCLLSDAIDFDSFLYKIEHPARRPCANENQIIMPPQRLFRHFPYISSSIVSRGVKSVVLAATLVLAGCATNANKQLAETNPSRIARDNYLSHIQSDPL